MVLDRDALFAVRKYEYSTWVLLSFGRLFITLAPKNPYGGKSSVWRGWEEYVLWPEEVLPFPFRLLSCKQAAVVPG